MTENRLVEIEIKLSRQEDLLDTLNQTVYQQQRQIDALEALCAALARRLKEAQDVGNERTPANEKPPHY